MRRRIMILLSVLFLVLAASVGGIGLVNTLSAQGKPAQDDSVAPPGRNQLVYPVKFVCGSIPGEHFDIPDGSTAFEPNMQKASREPPVKPGNYATAINIYNYQNDDVKFTKKAVIARPQGKPLGPISGVITESLGPGQALEVDCPNIASLFELGGQVVPDFIKGFVEIAVDNPRDQLEVVAVYTAEKMEVVQNSTCNTGPINVNTGFDQANSAVLTIGGTDPEWQVVASPVGIVSRDSDVVTNTPGWVSPFANSQWLSDTPTRGAPVPPAPTIHEFELEFDLGPGCTFAKLSALTRADDKIEVLLNGNTILSQVLGKHAGGTPIPVTASGTVSTIGLFLPGTNVLKVIVTDTQQVIEGFVLAGTVTAGGTVGVGTGVGLSIDVEYITPRMRR